MNRACNVNQGNDDRAGGLDIIRVGVRQEERMGVLPAVFGRHCLEFEMSVYGWMDTLCADYKGGYWEFYRLSNGGFYMAPGGVGRLTLVCFGNGFEGLSFDAAGIVASLFAYNGLACRYEREQDVEGYFRLRDYAFGHEEAGLIFRAID